jgi:hypothetical protein
MRIKIKRGMRPLNLIPPDWAEERFVMVYLQGSDETENAHITMNAT